MLFSQVMFFVKFGSALVDTLLCLCQSLLVLKTDIVKIDIVM